MSSKRAQQIHLYDRMNIDQSHELPANPPCPTLLKAFAMDPVVKSLKTRVSWLDLPGVPYFPPLSSAMFSTSASCCSFSTDMPTAPLEISAFHVSASDADVVAVMSQPLLEFTFFPMLPLELRTMVWTEACFLDRVIPVRCSPIIGRRRRPTLTNGQRLLPFQYTVYTKQPAILQTSQEAQKVGLKHYVLEFGTTDWEIVDEAVVKVTTPGQIYINFESDIICPILLPDPGIRNIFDSKLCQKLRNCTSLRRLGLRSSETDRRLWRAMLERNTFISEVAVFSELESVNAVLNTKAEGDKTLTLQLHTLQAYIDGVWRRAGLDDEEEDRLLAWKYNIGEDLRMKQMIKELNARKNALPPPTARVIPKISFGIMKAEAEAVEL
ncbi:hypothetical protein BKA65DRAFT_485257 [Rhexocercosporidium sp. MPI-PUGE-AT-0058]|nr:hypothetical protein BKA65DRAFT_485257 [Rhexocercosporidium sp. MPI-PUGE-AT-0058]